MNENVPNKGNMPFLRRYERSFALAGALIVFATFVVKEQLMERWKHTAESIELAKYMFSIRYDTSQKADLEAEHYSTLLQEMVQIAARTNPPSSTKVPPKPDALAWQRANYWRVKAQERPQLATTRARVEVLAVLAEQLPEGDDTIAGLNGEVDRLKQAYTDFFNDLRGEKDDKEVRHLNEVREGTIHDVYAELDRREELVLQQASILKVQNTAKAQTAEIASAVLYVLGWGLSFAGKLFGESDIVVES